MEELSLSKGVVFTTTGGKSNIILAPGPLHLFWTTGVYYLWELSKNYEVILIVGENYRQDFNFKNVIELAGITNVFYLRDGLIKKHIYYSNDFKHIVTTFKPICILHHDSVYISMMYLYYWGKKFIPSSRMISYLTGMVPTNLDVNNDLIVTFNIDQMANQYGIPKWLAMFIFRVKGELMLILDYYIMPILLVHEYFSPPLNVYSKRKLKNYWNDKFHHYLLYGGVEKKVLGECFGSEDGFRTINHPLTTCGTELNKIVYGVKENDNILILPSYGNVNHFQSAEKISNEDVVNLLSTKWIEAINALKNKFPNYCLFLKLHPNQKQDVLWKDIIGTIKSEFPNINILLPDENAQKWILKSKVIVSEVSSVLWWSSMLQSKISISFDIFGIPFSDDMKYYTGVYYFNSLRDFYATDFTKRSDDKLEAKKATPTLSHFLKEVLSNE